MKIFVKPAVIAWLATVKIHALSLLMENIFVLRRRNVMDDSKPINLLEALGIPTSGPQGPTKAPDQVALAVMQLASKYLLYERAEETAIMTAFAQVVEERHNNFHKKHVNRAGQIVNWAECSNQVCKEARDIITSTRKKEVYINPIAATLMGDYVINFMPMPGNLRLWLTKKSESQLPETQATKQQASRVVLTD